MKKHKKHTHDDITITIPIETDEYLRKFILDNSFMRNKIRNDFVEEANKYKGEYNMYYGFFPTKFKTDYYHSIEIPENRYNYYCTGISEQVAADFERTNKMIRTTNQQVIDHKSDNKLGEYKYKKFDFNKYSFRVKLKTSINDNSYKVRSKVKILDSNHIDFRVRSNKYNRQKENLIITLTEPLYDDIKFSDINTNHKFIRYYTINGIINEYTFYFTDIKDISFMYECGKYYIQLSVNVSYNINKKSLKYSKDRVCGIDTGIHHPATLHDGNNTMYLSMDEKTSRKIHYLERRIRRLKHYRSLKYNANIERTGYKYSNNTIKLTKKIRKLYRKITNIKKFWIQNRCKEIATTYSKICVDDYECPNANKDDSLPSIAKRRINYANRFHKMYYFNEFLKHDCIKYGCEYIKAPEDTTRTCSICGYVNDHLKLSERNLICKECGNVIERDMNAARNCYDYLIDNI